MNSKKNTIKPSLGFVLLIISVLFMISSCSSNKSDDSNLLDYSQPGNPPEVSLEPQQYLPGDKLYSSGHADYYKEGTPYLTAEIETSLRDLWYNHEGLQILINHSPEFQEKYSNIESIIYINSENKRKELYSEGITFFFDGFDNQLLEEQNPIGVLSESDKESVRLFIKEFYTLRNNFLGTNLSNRERWNVN